MKQLKGVFKPLKCYFKFANSSFAPYPVLWVSKPSYIQIVTCDIGWKDKYDTPRYEYSPYIWIHLFKFNLVWYWALPLHQIHESSDYWEQALWYLYYTNTISQGLIDKSNIDKAKESWPWEDMKGNSTWNDKFLIKNGSN